MDVSKIVSEIDAEIARLQQARAALIGLSGTAIPARKRGRPKGSTNTPKPEGKAKKRNLSPEGRKKIQEAMKRRWAAHRKEASK